MLLEQIVMLVEVLVDLQSSCFLESLADQIFLVQKQTRSERFEDNYAREHRSEQEQELVSLVFDVAVDAQDCTLAICERSTQQQRIVLEDRQKLAFAFLVGRCWIFQLSQPDE